MAVQLLLERRGRSGEDEPRRGGGGGGGRRQSRGGGGGGSAAAAAVQQPPQPFWCLWQVWPVHELREEEPVRRQIHVLNDITAQMLPPPPLRSSPAAPRGGGGAAAAAAAAGQGGGAVAASPMEVVARASAQLRGGVGEVATAVLQLAALLACLSSREQREAATAAAAVAQARRPSSHQPARTATAERSGGSAGGGGHADRAAALVSSSRPGAPPPVALGGGGGGRERMGATASAQHGASPFGSAAALSGSVAHAGGWMTGWMTLGGGGGALQPSASAAGVSGRQWAAMAHPSWDALMEVAPSGGGGGGDAINSHAMNMNSHAPRGLGEPHGLQRRVRTLLAAAPPLLEEMAASARLEWEDGPLLALRHRCAGAASLSLSRSLALSRSVTVSGIHPLPVTEPTHARGCSLHCTAGRGWAGQAAGALDGALGRGAGAAACGLARRAATAAPRAAGAAPRRPRRPRHRHRHRPPADGATAVATRLSGRSAHEMICRVGGHRGEVFVSVSVSDQLRCRWYNGAARDGVSGCCSL
jgi:hypothetical protein